MCASYPPELLVPASISDQVNSRPFHSEKFCCFAVQKKNTFKGQNDQIFNCFCVIFRFLRALQSSGWQAEFLQSFGGTLVTELSLRGKNFSGFLVFHLRPSINLGLVVKLSILRVFVFFCYGLSNFHKKCHNIHIKMNRHLHRK